MKASCSTEIMQHHKLYYVCLHHCESKTKPITCCMPSIKKGLLLSQEIVYMHADERINQ